MKQAIGYHQLPQGIAVTQNCRLLPRQKRWTWPRSNDGQTRSGEPMECQGPSPLHWHPRCTCAVLRNKKKKNLLTLGSSSSTIAAAVQAKQKCETVPNICSMNKVTVLMHLSRFPSCHLSQCRLVMIALVISRQGGGRKPSTRGH